MSALVMKSEVSIGSYPRIPQDPFRVRVVKIILYQC